MTSAKFTRRALLAVALLLSAPPAVHAKSPDIFTGLVAGTAVGGYDPVAYFTDGKPVAGRADITHQWKGATWRFSSEKNREAFKANPDRYAPQYGGYCAWAVSQGYTAKGEPAQWSIVGGKLYLNYNASVKKTWEKDPAANIASGDTNWPKVLEK